MRYKCEYCDVHYPVIEQCEEHEISCGEVQALVQAIAASLREGWNPYELEEIEDWTDGDKAELHRIAKRVLLGD